MLSANVLMLFPRFALALIFAVLLALCPARAQGADELDTLNQEVARLYQAGQYADAFTIAQRGLALAERLNGPDHPDVAKSATLLAVQYRMQSRYGDAEVLLKRALAIREKALGPDHPDVATPLNNLALLYRSQSRFADAEPLYVRSLAIWEKALGPDHPNLAVSLSNLGGSTTRKAAMAMRRHCISARWLSGRRRSIQTTQTSRSR